MKFCQGLQHSFANQYSSTPRYFFHTIFSPKIFSPVFSCWLLAGVCGGGDVVEVGVHVLVSQQRRVTSCS